MQEVDYLESLVVANDYERACAALEAFPSRDVHDPDVHLRLADVCEALGQAGRLVYELNWAYRDDPEDTDILKRLATVHTDAGRVERALRCWKTVTERCPGDFDAWESYAQLLQDSGRPEEALLVYEEAWRQTGDRRFQARQRVLPAVEETVDEAPGTPSDALLARFVSLFQGREGVYARQWSNRQRATGYTPIREPFTHAVARNHLLGNVTVGIYPLRVDNTVIFTALDLDVSKTLMEHGEPDSPARQGAMERLGQYADALRTCAARYGLHAYIEDSGYKGRHVWIFFEEPLPARSARRLGQALCRTTGPVPWDVSVEVFPKQGTLPPDGLGNLIKLPYGLHRLSGRRSSFLDGDTRLPDRFILDILRTPEASIGTFLAQAPSDHEPEAEPVPADEPRGRTTAPVIPYHLESDVQAQAVLSRCATLRALTDQAEQERRLSYEEAMVLIHSLGHIDTGPSAVNTLLRQALNTDPGLLMRGRLRGNPISCPKIRQKVPHVTSRVACNCEFPPGIGLYPTPLLHLNEPAASDPGAMESVQFQALLKDYIAAHQQVRDAQNRVEILVRRLSDWFERAGLETFDTPLGTLRRTLVDGKPVFELQV